MSAIRTVYPHPSDSSVQREIEVAVLARLQQLHPEWKRVQWKTTSAELGLSKVWRGTKPDAVWRETGEPGSPLIVAECYIRIGPLLAGHVRKMAMDVLKLLALQHALPKEFCVRPMLIVPDELSDRLTGQRWIIDALRLVEIVPVVLFDEERAKLTVATSLQADGQARLNEKRRNAA